MLKAAPSLKQSNTHTSFYKYTICSMCRLRQGCNEHAACKHGNVVTCLCILLKSTKYFCKISSVHDTITIKIYRRLLQVYAQKESTALRDKIL